MAHDSPPTPDDHPISPVAILELFEESWQQGREPRISDYLERMPSGTSAGRRELLEELVKIDLERRWRCSSTAGRDVDLWRLEDYLAAFPELGGPSGCPLELIVEEYRVRRRWGDLPSREDYTFRFPSQAAHLAERLRQVDDQLETEYASIAGQRLEPQAPPEALPVSSDQLVPPATCTRLLSICRQFRLLGPGQLNELGPDGSSAFPDVVSLAQELVRRGWLTGFQAERLLKGRAESLRVGQYLIEDRLGEGATGQVFKARHLAMNRRVALKAIRRELAADAEVMNRFYREMRVIGRVSSPHVVHAFDAGPTGAIHLIVMEYVEGTDLHRLVRERGPLPVPQACEYVRQAALGLQHIHEQRLVHRDIKPANLLLAMTPDALGTVKVADLGLARLLKRSGDQSFSSTLTQFGTTMMGTPDYMAPEQAIDFHGADIRADIYSLGCAFFFLLTGQPPFAGGNLTEKLLRHQHAELPDFTGFRTDVPERVAALVREMMAKNPENRCQTPGEIAETLAEIAHAPCKRKRAAPHNRRRWLTAAGGVLVIGGLTGFSLWPRRPRFVDGDGPARKPASTSRKTEPCFLDGLPLESIAGGSTTLNGRTGPLRAIQWSPKKRVTAIAIRPAGDLIAVGTAEGPILLWEVGTKRFRLLPGHSRDVSCVSFSPDGRMLASGSFGDEQVKLWDVTREAAPVNLSGPTGGVFTAVFSNRGLLAAGDSKGAGLLWSSVAGGKPIALGRHFTTATALSFDQRGDTLAVGGIAPSADRSSVFLWDVAASRGRLLSEIRSGVRALALSPQGDIVTAGRGEWIEFFTTETGKADGLIRAAHSEGRTLRSLAFSSDGRWLVSSGQDDNQLSRPGEVIVWDVRARAKRQEWTLPKPNPSGGAVFTSDGRHLLTATIEAVYILRLGLVP